MSGPALELIGVSKRFGATTVLERVDLVVARGERHALIGPNGAGKSTLFDLIAGATAPTHGRILIDAAAPGRRGTAARARAGLARSFQHSSVFSRLSVFDNLRCAALHAPAQRRRAWAWLRESPDIDRAADEAMVSLGLSAYRDVPAGALGYAEQRALDIGIALATGASLFLFDEPTAGMSREQAARTIELVRAATVGRTLVMIEHDMDAVFGLADRISVLVRGRIVATGTPDAIRADPAVRDAYLGADSGGTFVVGTHGGGPHRGAEASR